MWVVVVFRRENLYNELIKYLSMVSVSLFYFSSYFEREILGAVRIAQSSVICLPISTARASRNTNSKEHKLTRSLQTQ